MWMHVDGTWGGAALLSPRHRHLLAGCERSDSLSWNAHKMMVCACYCHSHPYCGFQSEHLRGSAT